MKNKIDKDTVIIGVLLVLSVFIIYLIITTNPGGEYPKDYRDVEYMPQEDDSANYHPEDAYLSLNEMEQALNESANYNISEMENDIQMLEDTLENASQNET